MAAPGQPTGEHAAETAAEILRNGGRPRRSRAAARAGLTAAIVLGLAVAAGVAGLSLLANIGDGNHQRAGSAISGPPLRVVSVRPRDNSSGVNGATDVEIAFSAQLARTPAVPSFHPAVSGHWRASGRLLSFTPTSGGFEPYTRYTLRIPAGKAGLRSVIGGTIREPVIVTFRTGGYS